MGPEREAALLDTGAAPVAAPASVVSGVEATLAPAVVSGVEDTFAGDSAPAFDLASLPVRDPARYRRIAEIARGGMGRIVAVEDLELCRTIAIKEILCQSDEVERRFEREIRITARLQHPAIIGVLEGGRWPDGTPFYAMERIEGRPLDQIIAGEETLAARVGLLPHAIAVAEAIAYAHGRGVIHRDLKPGNVLCGAFGETVVVDWGLAKDLRPEERGTVAGRPGGPGGHPWPAGSGGGLTVLGEAMGTPAYMPPEQALGEAVDERADVYSLGAMLYHILAGRMPYHGARSASDLLVRVIAGPPAALQTIVPETPADLVAVVDKAMARDPADRYPTAGELAADLRRFQTGRLVGAHRYSSWQLVRRWLSRHRGVVAVSALAVIALAALAATSVARIRGERDAATAQRQLAEDREASVEELLDFMLQDLKSRLEPLGQLPLLDLVARKADAYYRGRPVDWSRPGDPGRRAMAQRNLGDVLAGQGDLPAALAQYRASHAIFERLAAGEPDKVEWQGHLAEDHARMGAVFQDQGDLAGALTAFRTALAINQRLVARLPEVAVWRRNLSVDNRNVGDVLRDQGDLAGALAAYRSTLAIGEELAASDPGNSDAQDELAVAHSRIGDLLGFQSAPSEALGEYRAGLAILERLSARDPENADWRRGISLAHDRIGDVLRAQGDSAGALTEYRAYRAIAGQLAERDPTNVGWQIDLSVSRDKVGDVLLDRGDLAGALAEYRASLAIVEPIAARDPTSTESQRNLFVAHGKIGTVLSARGDVAGTLAAYQSSLEIAERLAASDPANAAGQYDLFTSRINLGEVLRAKGDRSGALDASRAGLEVAERLIALEPGNTQWQRGLSLAQSNICQLLLEQNDLTGAKAACQVALDVSQRLVASDPKNVEWQRDLSVGHQGLADVLGAGRDAGAARAHYRKALAIVELLAADHPDVADYRADVRELRRRLAKKR